MATVRGIVYAAGTGHPTTQGPVDVSLDGLCRLTGGRLIQMVACGSGVVAVCAEDGRGEGLEKNPNATRAATRRIPLFSNSNMFYGNVVFLQTDDTGEYIDLDETWDAVFAPHVPQLPLHSLM